MILDKFPTTEEFYETYWGKKPFIVRDAIDKNIMDSLIDGDALAGLSLEEDIKSRIVMTADEGNKWSCDHGPFNENKFTTLGEKNWSLLVQNVEQYHLKTANLLRAFNFSPRWLMDDIMVSYSTAGGSVGPHTDSYHVFIVQGIGQRKWTIARQPIDQPIKKTDYIDGLDLKVLKAPVEGVEVEVSMGDVIYIPPNFAHEGITLNEAMSFSVGFLGPQISELLVEYGHYLTDNEQHDTRYVGHGLSMSSAGFNIAPQDQKTLQDELVGTIKADSFSKWLAIYFSTPTHDDVENIQERENKLSREKLLSALQAGRTLHRPDHIKLSITSSKDGTLHLSVYGKEVSNGAIHDKLLDWLNQNNAISMANIDELGMRDEIITLITSLYNQNILFFEGEDLH